MCSLSDGNVILMQVAPCTHSRFTARVRSCAHAPACTRLARHAAQGSVCASSYAVCLWRVVPCMYVAWRDVQVPSLQVVQSVAAHSKGISAMLRAGPFVVTSSYDNTLGFWGVDAFNVRRRPSAAGCARGSRLHAARRLPSGASCVGVRRFLRAWRTCSSRCWSLQRRS